MSSKHPISLAGEWHAILTGISITWRRRLPREGLGDVKLILYAPLLRVGQEHADVAKEDPREALPALKYVAFIFGHVLKGVHQSIVYLLRAVLGGRLVVEVDDVHGENLLAHRPLMLGPH